MDFQLALDHDNYRRRIREFVEENLFPLERDFASDDEHENIREDLLQALRVKA